jgi:hypothetical protein
MIVAIADTVAHAHREAVEDLSDALHKSTAVRATTTSSIAMPRSIPAGFIYFFIFYFFVFVAGGSPLTLHSPG